MNTELRKAELSKLMRKLQRGARYRSTLLKNAAPGFHAFAERQDEVTKAEFEARFAELVELQDALARKIDKTIEEENL